MSGRIGEGSYGPSPIWGVGGVGGGGSPANTINAVISAIAAAFFSIATPYHPGSPPSLAQQKEWAIELQQAANGDPSFQAFLNQNPSILQNLNAGAFYGGKQLFEDLSSFVEANTESTMTPAEQVNFAKGWTASASIDFLSGYTAEGLQKLKNAMAQAIAALRLLLPNPIAATALNQMEDAKQQIDQVVYKPNTVPPAMYNIANWSVLYAYESLEKI